MIHGNEDLSPVIFTFQGRTPDPVWYIFWYTIFNATRVSSFLENHNHGYIHVS